MLVSNLALRRAGKVKLCSTFTIPAVPSARFDTNIGFFDIFHHYPLKYVSSGLFERLVIKDVEKSNVGIKPITGNSWEGKTL